MTRSILALAAFALALGTAVPGAHAALHSFTAEIDEAQETPPNGSAGTGTGTFVLDDVTGLVSFTVTFSGLGSAEIASHVHVAPPGVPGGIVYALPLGSPKVGISPALSAAEQADMLAGNHYVNIHSVNFPGGEIRGQIVPDGPATQLLPTKLFIAKNPGAADKRKIVYKVKQLAPNSFSVEGDPMVDGAKLKVKLDATTQCFDLPASGWSPISDIGFKYKDPQFVNGPVKVALIKKTPSGVFLAKVIAQSAVQAVDIVPPNPGTQVDTNFSIGDDREYCGSSAGGILNPNNDKTLKVKDAPPPAVCNVTACPP